MISKDEVQHIAKLARLGITDEEISQLTLDLSAILDYVEKLKEVDVKGVEPMSHSLKMENIIREDEENEELNGKGDKLMNLAPEKKDGYLKVKSVF